ncbi:DUF6470 family protein [Niallia sp. 03133]|uniref:DUF6470 family protein n=1 Tax=Niallia sp. 03133 TaxID=3458060 RepID=UPI004043A10B
MFPQIRLQSTFGQIEITTRPGTMEIEQPKADLSIEQPAAEMNIERTPSKLTIDQTKAREDVDLKSIRVRKEEAAQLGKQALLEGIARRIQDGDELMRIENGGNPIKTQAKRNSEGPPKQFGLAWIPSAGSVKVGYDPGNVEINWKTHAPTIETTINKPIFTYRPGEVNISLKQYPSLTIDFDNLKYVGTNYEQSI